MRFVVFSCLLTFTCCSAFAGESLKESVENLIKSKSLRCYFAKSVMWDSTSDQVEQFKEKMQIQVDSINYKTRKARLIGNAGAETITAVLTSNGAHFIEITSGGNINVITAFLPGIKGHYMAVYSRHMGYFPLSNYPLPSQRYGVCKIWDM